MDDGGGEMSVPTLRDCYKRVIAGVVVVIVLGGIGLLVSSIIESGCAATFQRYPPGTELA